MNRCATPLTAIELSSIPPCLLSLAILWISHEHLDMHGLDPTRVLFYPIHPSHTSFSRVTASIYQIERIRWDGAAAQARMSENPERLDEVLVPSGGRKQPLRACGEFGDGGLLLRCGNDASIAPICAYGYHPIKGRFAHVDIMMAFGRIDRFLTPDLNTWP